MSARTGLGSCRIPVALDGLALPWANVPGVAGIEDVVAREEVLAIEVFLPGQVPSSLSRLARMAVTSGGLASPQGGASGAGLVDCGLIAIWTRPFATKS